VCFHGSLWQNSVGPRYGAIGPEARRHDEVDAPPSIEEWQRSSWPDAAVTRRAEGGSGPQALSFVGRDERASLRSSLRA
jgi:hypothetical protein